MAGNASNRHRGSVAQRTMRVLGLPPEFAGPIAAVLGSTAVSLLIVQLAGTPDQLPEFLLLLYKGAWIVICLATGILLWRMLTRPRAWWTRILPVVAIACFWFEILGYILLIGVGTPFHQFYIDLYIPVGWIGPVSIVLGAVVSEITDRRRRSTAS